MQVKIKYKPNGKLTPAGSVKTYDTPFGEENNEWECAFCYSESTNAYSLALFHYDKKTGKAQISKNWLVKANFSWEEYQNWLNEHIEYVYIDADQYYPFTTEEQQ